MSTQKETRSAFVGFFGTLPGIITAIAGLITALVAAGLIGSAVGGNGQSSTTEPGGTDGDPVVEMVVVPDVVEWFINDAIAELDAHGLPHVVTPEASDEVPEGFVIAQHPQPGSSVEPGTLIELWESTPSADIL